MELYKIKDRDLEEELKRLKQRLIPQMGQASVREVLTAGELHEIRKEYVEYCHKFKKDQSGKDLDQDPPNFNLYFDTNGESNFAFLARQKSIIKSTRLGFGRRNWPFDRSRLSTIRPADGFRLSCSFISAVSLSRWLPVSRWQVTWLNSDPCKEPTGQQVVLQNFEQRGWPNSIPAPNLSWKQLKIENPKLSGEELRKLTKRQWSSAKVKSVCLQLRKSFKNELRFGEGEGGKLIRMKDIASQEIKEDKPKVTPK